jgi:hypothetical protein
MRDFVYKFKKMLNIVIGPSLQDSEENVHHGLVAMLAVQWQSELHSNISVGGVQLEEFGP